MEGKKINNQQPKLKYHFRKSNSRYFYQVIVLFVTFTAASYGQNLRQSLNLGNQLELQGNTSEARMLYEELYKMHPWDAGVFSRLQRLYFKEEEYEKSLELVNRRIQKFPSDVSLKTTQAHIYYKQGKTEEAFSQWQLIMERHPRNQAAFIRIASAMLQEALIDKAIEVYLTGKKTIGKPATFAFYLANIYSSRLQFRAAVKELLLHLQAFPKQNKLIESQLLRYMKSAAPVDHISDELKKSLRKNPGLTVINQILSSVYLESENFSNALKAIIKFEESTPSKESGNGLYTFAEKAFSNGYIPVALGAYNIIFNDYPGHRLLPRVIMGRARCYEASDQFSKAQDEYRHLVDTFPKLPIVKGATLKLAKLQHEKLWLVSDAEQTCRLLIQRYPDSREASEGRLMLGRLLLSQGKTAAADTVFTALANRHKKTMGGPWVEAVVFKARSEFFQLNFPEATTTLSELNDTKLSHAALLAPALNNGLELKIFISKYSQNSSDGLAVFAQASLLEYQRHYPQAVDTLDLYLKTSDDSTFLPEIFLFKSRLLVKSGHKKKALESLETAIERFPAHFIADDLLDTAAEISVSLKIYPKAVRYYEKILTDHPGSLFTDHARQQIRKIENET